jgi:sigma-B regulation protein RsbU (phosphoserine phosphatase)
MDPILDAAPCGFLTVSDDGHVLAANAMMLQLLGVSAATLTGKHVDTILDPASRIFYQTHVFPTLKLHGRVLEVYLTVRDGAGNEVCVLVNAARRPRNERLVSDWVLMPVRRRNEPPQPASSGRQYRSAVMP